MRSKCKCSENYTVCIVCHPEILESAEVHNKLILDHLELHLAAAKHAYYCTDKPLMQDTRYDMIEEHIRKYRPDSWILTAVGCPRCAKIEEEDLC